MPWRPALAGRGRGRKLRLGSDQMDERPAHGDVAPTSTSGSITCLEGDASEGTQLMRDPRGVVGRSDRVVDEGLGPALPRFDRTIPPVQRMVFRELVQPGVQLQLREVVFVEKLVEHVCLVLAEDGSDPRVGLPHGDALERCPENGILDRGAWPHPLAVTCHKSEHSLHLSPPCWPQTFPKNRRFVNISIDKRRFLRYN